MPTRPELTPYAPLPHSVLRRTDLSDAAKLVFAALADLRPDADGLVAVSVGRLCEMVPKERRAIQRLLRVLERRNLIEGVRRPGRRTRYRLLPGAASASPAAPQAEGGVVDDAPQGASRTTQGGRRARRGGGVAHDAPARVTAFSTASPTPRGVPPLVWESALTRLRTAYAEAFGDGTPMPNRWRRLLGEQLAADGQAIVAHLTADALRRGLAMANAAKPKPRPYGFGWVVLAIQEQQIIGNAQRAAQQRQRQEARAATAPPEDIEAPGAEELREQVAWFADLPTDRQAPFRERAEAEAFVTNRPDVIEMFAAQLAWAAEGDSHA